MIMTFDWLQDANRDPKWKKSIEDAISCDKPQELFHQGMYRLSFNPRQQMVTVQPFSDDSMFGWKVIPKKLTHELVYELINGNWDAFSEDNVFDVPES